MGVTRLISAQESNIYPYPHIFLGKFNIKRYEVYFLSLISACITDRKQFIIIKLKKKKKKQCLIGVLPGIDPGPLV